VTVSRRERFVEWLRLIRIAARLVAGRRFWIPVLLPLLWLAFHILRLFIEGWSEGPYESEDAQNLLIGVPLTVLATGLGMRIIAGEIDQRTLEIAYTVPGGTHRVWLAKLMAAALIVLAAETLLAAVTYVFCTGFPIGALYGAFQSAMFYMVLAMGLAALFKSEATGALVTVAVAFVNSLLQGGNVRISPFFNPDRLVDEANAIDILAWTVQNRIGFVLIIVAITALAFGRAERREKMLSG